MRIMLMGNEEEKKKVYSELKVNLLSSIGASYHSVTRSDGVKLDISNSAGQERFAANFSYLYEGYDYVLILVNLASEKDYQYLQGLVSGFEAITTIDLSKIKILGFSGQNANFETQTAEFSNRYHIDFQVIMPELGYGVVFNSLVIPDNIPIANAEIPVNDNSNTMDSLDSLPQAIEVASVYSSASHGPIFNTGVQASNPPSSSTFNPGNT